MGRIWDVYRTYIGGIWDRTYIGRVWDIFGTCMGSRTYMGRF